MMEIAGYELIEKIADGGMGTVWKARQLSLDRLVAIKVLGKSSLPDQEARDRFRKEAQTAARLNHPGIVQVFDAGEVEGAAYLVMEYVEGESVSDLILQHGAIKEAKALEMVAGVARALAYAWEKECLIHCDVNPSNILIDHNTKQIKVADLGLARMISVRHPNKEDDLILGTPNYTAPEQSEGLADLDCRADIYSLGATLYHMATGKLPFHDAKGSQAMTRHEKDYLEDPGVVNPELSVPAAWLIEKLMIKNRALRHHFWTQVIKDVEEVGHGQMPLPPLPDEGASTVRRSPNRLLVPAKTQPGLPPAARREPKKLIIKKMEVPAAVPVTPQHENQVATALRNLGFLLVLAVAVYAVLLYYGKIKGPPLPFRPEAPLESAVENAGEIEWGDEVEPTPSDPAKRVDLSTNEDFIQGARLFNQALADYKAYQENREDTAALSRVEANSREAITYFEACKEVVPDGNHLDQYITQCYGLIANVRHSTKLDDAGSPEASSDSKLESAPDETVADQKSLVYVDEEPAAVSPPAEPAKTVNLLRLSLAGNWNLPTPGALVFGRELQRLLSRHATATLDTQINASVVLYPGVTCMMTAKDAARVLNQPLPMRRSLDTPGFPSGSLFSYQFKGDFSGAQELTLVCDMNDRVVLAQLYDERIVPARMEETFFSSNWSVYDFIGARLRSGADGLIAHRVRKRDNLIRLDTEVAVGDGVSGQERMAKVRVALMMPVQFAGMILQVNHGSR